MKVTGIVAEYNPFHNGHLYQLEKAREETNADYIIVVMSGDFVQRGAPAIIDKYSRAEMALRAGADLVLELPVYYATSSADYFAGGACALLDKLHVVDYLSFGSEHGNVDDLIKIAKLSAIESPAYSVALNRYLVEGRNFAYANTHALIDSCTDSHLKSIIEFVTRQPNNSLGIAYIKALLRRESTIVPHTVYRLASGYHDTSENALSASGVRSELMRTKDIRSLSSQVPDFVLSEMQRNYHKTFPIIRNDFSSLLAYKLRFIQFEDELLSREESYADKEATTYLDISKSLARRIAAGTNQFESFKQFADLLKTKNIAHASICRGLTHILLDIKKSRMDEFIQNDYIGYARMLGFRKESTPLLSEIKKQSEIPLIAKLRDAKQNLDASSLTMLNSDLFAADLYEQIAGLKFHHPFRSEYTQEIIRIDAEH